MIQADASPDVDVAALVGDLRTERPPLYAALASRLQLLIGDGRLPLGARLPAERELAARVHLSRATVAAAYARLREDGWAEARQGAGTWTRVPSGSGYGAWLIEPPTSGVIEMAHAAPSASPRLAAAYRAAMSTMPEYLPSHGYFPIGLPDLRQRIAERYAARGLATSAEQIIVTSGSLQALSLVLDVVGRPGERILVEAPSYPNALDAITRHSLGAVPVAVDSLDADAVPRDIQKAARSTNAQLAYVMPDYQNPTGLHLDDAIRGRLAPTFADAGAIAIVDETQAELRLDGDASTPFAVFGRSSDVVTIGSMSKSFWGGLRIGWIRADLELVPQLMSAGAARQLGQPVFEQLVACELLDHADAFLDERIGELRRQRDHLAAELRKALPDWDFVLPPGGLVLWCRLADGLSSSFLAGGGLAQGLRLAAGPRFGSGYAYDDRLRLPYTHPEAVLTQAVSRLVAATGATSAVQSDEPDVLV